MLSFRNRRSCQIFNTVNLYIIIKQLYCRYLNTLLHITMLCFVIYIVKLKFKEIILHQSYILMLRLIVEDLKMHYNKFNKQSNKQWVIHVVVTVR